MRQFSHANAILKENEDGSRGKGKISINCNQNRAKAIMFYPILLFYSFIYIYLSH